MFDLIVNEEMQVMVDAKDKHYKIIRPIHRNKRVLNKYPTKVFFSPKRIINVAPNVGINV